MGHAVNAVVSPITGSEIMARARPGIEGNC